jgi:hypothetical protein
LFYSRPDCCKLHTTFCWFLHLCSFGLAQNFAHVLCSFTYTISKWNKTKTTPLCKWLQCTRAILDKLLCANYSHNYQSFHTSTCAWLVTVHTVLLNKPCLCKNLTSWGDILVLSKLCVSYCSY